MQYAFKAFTAIVRLAIRRDADGKVTIVGNSAIDRYLRLQAYYMEYEGNSVTEKRARRNAAFNAFANLSSADRRKINIGRV